MEEIWKDIEGYEELYQVSNFGNVRSKDRFITQRSRGGNYFTRIFPGREIKQTIQNSGYKMVMLSKHSKVKLFSVHRLVANAFIKKPKNKNTVNHKDGDKENNRLENLEWCTLKENLDHANNILKRHRNNWRRVRCIELNEEFESCAEAGRKLKINSNYIRFVIDGKEETAGGYTWEEI